MIFEGIVTLVIIYFSAKFVLSRKQKTQLAYIQNYKFNSAISKKVKEKYPHLSAQDISLVLRALKDYFYICNKAKRKMVSMPSQVVDVAWHEFILFTRQYQQFCDKALGRFLHHTPAEAMTKPTAAQDGIKRAWRIACEKYNIHPSSPNRLPLIFEIDTKLNIPDGFKYSTNCLSKSAKSAGADYCAAHIGCSSGCAGDSGGDSEGGFFDSFGGDSSGCGGGCGGD
ncbi:glycine-rich domain-containing protein [Pleionea sediminis]|uniref:glycine-rich domain-containing protein n=1 Tax=Pleionea sediminis TaxID=2569479 RepID=UPI00118486A0|nr:hypothetical protein [Pleionea sediminis]